jgi:hypothetical protein
MGGPVHAAGRRSIVPAMRLCALVSLLGICGALPGQMAAQVFDVGGALGALEDKVGPVSGELQPVDRFERLFTSLLKRENKAAAGRLMKAMIRANQQMLLVQGDKELLDLVQAALDEMRRETLPRFHLTCTVLVMPLEVAAAHGLAPETDDKVRKVLERAQARGNGGIPTNDVQEADMAAMTNLMRDVVKQKGKLLNLPEIIAMPFVPFVAEPRVAGEGKQPLNDAENLRVRGEALAVSAEEAVFGVQLVRGSLPADRTVLPKDPVFDRAFRLRVGSGVTITAKNDKAATVLWLRFTGTSTVEPKAATSDKADKKGDNGPR